MLIPHRVPSATALWTTRAPATEPRRSPGWTSDSTAKLWTPWPSSATSKRRRGCARDDLDSLPTTHTLLLRTTLAPHLPHPSPRDEAYSRGRDVVERLKITVRRQQVVHIARTSFTIHPLQYSASPSTTLPACPLPRPPLPPPPRSPPPRALPPPSSVRSSAAGCSWQQAYRSSKDSAFSVTDGVVVVVVVVVACTLSFSLT